MAARVDQERGNQLDAILLMLRELIRDRWTVRELAERIHVNRRTAYRYLGIVRKSGVRLVQERDGVNKFYRADAPSVRRALGL